ncbi:unnamed protein product, partial [Effrenium voratum]
RTRAPGLPRSDKPWSFLRKSSPSGAGVIWGPRLRSRCGTPSRPWLAPAEGRPMAC